ERLPNSTRSLEMPRQPMAAGHFPDRHGVDITDQLTGQPPSDMSAPPHQDLGVVLEEPLPTLTTREPATNPLQRGGPAMGREIPHPQTTGVVDPSGLEPTM